MNKYLEVMARVFGFDGRESLPTLPLEGLYDYYADIYSELYEQIKGEGIEIGEFKDPGDGTWCVWENGDLKLTAYISTRGELYQAGAYDGENAYGATNLQTMHNGVYEFPVSMKEWTPVTIDWICAKIAKDGWDEANNQEGN